MGKILDKLKGTKKPENQTKLKMIHIVEMKDDKPGTVTEVRLSPGTKVKDLKNQLGYKAKDTVIRALDRQVLANDIDIPETIENGEKLIIALDTEMGA